MILLKKDDVKQKQPNRLFSKVEEMGYYFETTGDDNEPLLFKLEDSSAWKELKRRFDKPLMERGEEMLKMLQLILDYALETVKDVTGKPTKREELFKEIKEELHNVYGVKL